MDRTHVGHLSYMATVSLATLYLAAGTLLANLRFDDGHVKMIVKNKVVTLAEEN